MVTCSAAVEAGVFREEEVIVLDDSVDWSYSWLASLMIFHRDLHLQNQNFSKHESAFKKETRPMTFVKPFDAVSQCLEAHGKSKDLKSLWQLVFTTCGVILRKHFESLSVTRRPHDWVSDTVHTTDYDQTMINSSKVEGGREESRYQIFLKFIIIQNDIMILKNVFFIWCCSNDNLIINQN